MIEVAGWQISQSTLLFGGVTGLLYALLAAGFVLVYRSTGVLNFAQAEIGAIAAGLLVVLHARYDAPYWLAATAAVVAATAYASLAELIVVRRLFDAPRLVLFVATIGIAQIALLVTLSLPDVTAPGPYPLPPWFDTLQWQVTDDLTVRGRDLLVVLVAPTLILLLGWVLNATSFGLAVRASATNAEASRLYGISVRRVSTAVWTIAGLLAGVTAILIAPVRGITAAQAGSAGLGPGLLLRVLVVAVIARMRSLTVTLVAGIAVGLVEGIALLNLSTSQITAIDLYLFVVLLVVVLASRRTVRTADDESQWALTPVSRPLPDRYRLLPAAGLAALLVAAAVLGLALSQPSQLFLWTRVLLFAMVALSLSMLIGWAGQLSLGQFAFVGLGGLTTAAVYRGGDIPVPFDLWDMSFELPWGAAVAVGTAVGVVAAVVVGLPALRVRGLFLAVTTFGFAVVTASWLFVQDVFLQGRTTVPDLPKPVFGPFDFASRKSFYFLVLVFVILTAVLLARLRRTNPGREMIAVRDNEQQAAACGVSPAAVKLGSFALAGGIAALAGALLVTALPGFGPQVAFSPDESIRIVAVAIIGGLGTIAGPLLGALWVLGLPAAFGDTQEIRLMTSGIGLLVLLMFLPGGLIQIVYRARDAIVAGISTPAPDPAVARVLPSPGARHVELPAVAGPWLETRDVRVRFGGNVAVDGVSLTVHRGELVGLIGSNGAGKSTLMNAVSGLVPYRGEVAVLGRNFDGVRAHRRHRLGLGRGFQDARLFPDLTVRETLLVASPRADEVIDVMGLGGHADELIGNLSTGTRRIVEMGSLLAVDARVLLLDEPTGGVAQREAEAFAPLLLRIRDELDACMLVIEHDMPLIMGISDRIYCLEAGAVIAEGPPAAVRADPRVIASYLGTNHGA